MLIFQVTTQCVDGCTYKSTNCQNEGRSGGSTVRSGKSNRPSSQVVLTHPWRRPLLF